MAQQLVVELASVCMLGLMKGKENMRLMNLMIRMKGYLVVLNGFLGRGGGVWCRLEKAVGWAEVGFLWRFWDELPSLGNPLGRVMMCIASKRLCDWEDRRTKTGVDVLSKCCWCGNLSLDVRACSVVYCAETRSVGKICVFI